jgi:hypothetical protein
MRSFPVKGFSPTHHQIHDLGAYQPLFRLRVPKTSIELSCEMFAIPLGYFRRK